MTAPTTPAPVKEPNAGQSLPAGAARFAPSYYDEAGVRRSADRPVPVDQFGRLVGIEFTCRSRSCRKSEARWYPIGAKQVPVCPLCHIRMVEVKVGRAPLLPWRALWAATERPLRPVWALLAADGAAYMVDAAHIPTLVLAGAAPVVGYGAKRVTEQCRLKVAARRGRLELEDPNADKRLRASIGRAARGVGYTAAAGTGWLALVAGLGVDPSTWAGRVSCAAMLAVWALPAASYWRRLRLARRQPAPVVVEPAVKVADTDPDEEQVRHIWTRILAVQAGQVIGYGPDGKPIKATQNGRLPGTILEDWYRLPGGWGATIVGPIGAYESDHYTAAIGRIASAYSVRKSMVTVMPDPEDENRAMVMVQRSSPLKGVQRWAGPDSIDVQEGTAPVATYADSTPVPYELFREGWGSPHDFLCGTTGAGKALAVGTPIPTPDGWTTMGQLRTGDRVFDENGQVCNVTHAFDVMNDRPCYEVEFSDGTVIVADADHLWKTITQRGRWQRDNHNRGKAPRPEKRVMLDVEPVTTREIAETLHATRGGDQPAAANHAVQVCDALEYDKRDLPVAPYTLGAWLGDGRTDYAAITCADPEILDRIRLDGYEVTSQAEPLAFGITNRRDWRRRISEAVRLVEGGLAIKRAAVHVGVSAPSVHNALSAKTLANLRQLWGADHLPADAPWGPYEPMPTLLREIGVLGNKHIPESYLHASIEQRRALLAGLLDTDGTCGKNGNVEFAVTCERLARDVLELVIGLGYRASIRTKRVKGKTEASSTCYTVAFTAHDRVFGLDRKAARQRVVANTSTSRWRYIVAARPVPSVPVRCIAVDSPSHLFLASRSCIPTHNSEALSTLLVVDRWAHFVGADGIPRGLVADLLIDPQQGQSYEPFMDDLAAPVAVELEEAKVMVQAVRAEMLRRNKYLSKRGWRDKDGVLHRAEWTDKRGIRRHGRKWWDPRVDGPILTLNIDEAHEFLADREFAALVTSGARMYRKCGIRIRVVTHTPLLTDLGGSMALRSMLTGGFVWCGRTADRLSGNTAFNGRLPADPCSLPLDPGMGFVMGGLATKPMTSRMMWEEDYLDWIRDSEGNPIGYPAELPAVTWEAFGSEFARWVDARNSESEWVPESPVGDATMRVEQSSTAKDRVFTVLAKQSSPVDMDKLSELLTADRQWTPTRTIRDALGKLREAGLVFTSSGQHELTPQAREQMEAGR